MRLEQFSAVTLGKKIADRELSCREVTAYFLERAQRLNGATNAFINLVDDSSAMERASEIDRALEGSPQSQMLSRGPLTGIPVGIKDVLCLEGFATTCASRMLEHYLPPYSATCLQQLLGAGLVPLGKTNMDEFAMGSSTENSAFGISRNPWDLDRTPGGSSGGAAAALAAGMVPLSIGSDTGGSVRQPAAFCGVCGLKPTYGLISRFGLVAYASSLDQVGPMAHYVEDVAALLQVLAGHDPRDSTSLRLPAKDYLSTLNGSIEGLRVGIASEQLNHPSVGQEIADSVRRAAEILKSLGASIHEIHLSHTDYSVAAYYVIAPCEASSNLARYEAAHYGFRESAPPPGQDTQRSPLEGMMVRSRTRGFGEEVKRRIMLGTFALSAGYSDQYYKQALKVRRLIADDYRSAFEGVDLILGPVAPTTAFKLGEKIDDPVQMYLGDLFTVDANLAGLPAISLPCGFDGNGLPLAIQLQGPQLAESRLLNTAYQLQQAGMFEPRVAELS
jgi:aspartyl-tRNA(Asn)/glutamyl-tRNA(Gln) amidotransferase subunit A